VNPGLHKNPSPSVGALYERPFFRESTKYGAVIDRPDSEISPQTAFFSVG